MLRRLLVLNRTSCGHMRSMSTGADSKSSMYFLPDTDSSDEELIVSDNGTATLVTLNRPDALNALNIGMIDKLYTTLKTIESKAGIYTTIVRGAGGRAYCAGGDVKAIYMAKNNGEDMSAAKDFFRREYTLNHLIATLKSNYVAIMDGITMGGGVGISLPGRFRIATENTNWAMPETAIGLFPDVGASYFLPRLRGHMGMYLALTGATLMGADALHAGIATHYVPSHLVTRVVDRIQEVEYDPESIDFAIRERTARTEPSPGLATVVPLIDQHFGKDSVEAIMSSLRESDSEFAAAVLKKLSAMSPLSLKITFKELRAGRHMTLEQCFQMEYRLACHCLNGGDFFEGVRAALIDKDRLPKWQFATVEEVSDSVVNSYFAPIEKELLLTATSSVSRL